MIVMYTQEYCPKCKVLKQKMDAKNMEYAECSDRDIVFSEGIDVTRGLMVDGQMMSYGAAIKWVNGRRGV